MLNTLSMPCGALAMRRIERKISFGGTMTTKQRQAWTMGGRLGGAVLVMAGVLQCQSAAADDKNVIEYRQHVMQALDGQAAALGQIVSGAVPDDNAAAHMEALALTASIALKAFEPKVQGGDAMPEIWSKWPDFSKRMKEFAQKTADATREIKAKGKDADLSTLVVDALNCKGCHDSYRREKK